MTIFDFIATLSNATLSSPVTYEFSIAISIIFLLGLFFQNSRVGFLQRFSIIAPNLLITVGVLGTFFGIALGLLNFNVADIDGSVPELLAGLKIAFITSIWGMSASIILKIAQTIMRAGTKKAEVAPEDIYSTLEAIREDANNQSVLLIESTQDIRNAIAAEGDSSLLSQMQKMRSETRDGQQELIKEFREFAQHMIENNQKALIEALREVISDFNKNLTEQFGENFKELNAAVHKLVDWQENYKLHVEKIENRVDLALEAIERSENSLKAVRDYASAIPEAIRPLEPVMTGLNVQVSDLEQHLAGLAHLRSQAIEAFPIIEKNLEKVTTELSDMAGRSIEKSSEALERHSQRYKSLEEAFDGLQQQASDAQQTFNAELGKALDAINAQVITAVKHHGELIEGNAEAAQESMKKAWENTTANIASQMGNFDEQMQQELTRAIQTLGDKLGSLSEKFVSDYTPLTERLRKVVAMTNGV